MEVHLNIETVETSPTINNLRSAGICGRSSMIGNAVLLVSASFCLADHVMPPIHSHLILNRKMAPLKDIHLVPARFEAYMYKQYAVF